MNAPNTVSSSCADGSSGTYHSDESLDRLKVISVDGTNLAPGKQVRIEATVWAYSGYPSDKLDLYYAADASAPVWTYLTTLTPSAAGAQTLTATYTLPAGAEQVIRGVFRYGGSPGPCVSGSYNDHDDLIFATQ
jgi:leucyl aminopeptidase